MGEKRKEDKSNQQDKSEPRIKGSIIHPQLLHRYKLQQMNMTQLLEVFEKARKGSLKFIK